MFSNVHDPSNVLLDRRIARMSCFAFPWSAWVWAFVFNDSIKSRNVPTTWCGWSPSVESNTRCGRGSSSCSRWTCHIFRINLKIKVRIFQARHLELTTGGGGGGTSGFCFFGAGGAIFLKSS